MKRVSGIYQITNVTNGKCYIGSAIDIETRLTAHQNLLKNNKHHCIHLQHSYNKHGPDAFKYTILLCCSKKQLIQQEQKAIDIYKPEYNVCQVAGSSLGCKHTEETKRKISLSNLGKRLGCNHTKETKAKMSKAKKGRKYSEETKNKMRLAWVNRKIKQCQTH